MLLRTPRLANDSLRIWVKEYILMALDKCNFLIVKMCFNFFLWMCWKLCSNFNGRITKVFFFKMFKTFFHSAFPSTTTLSNHHLIKFLLFFLRITLTLSVERDNNKLSINLQRTFINLQFFKVFSFTDNTS